ncbi:putative ferric-chelate reductase 1 isoform X2 [Hemicordylus capensis]|uniref:putative ferric-chelate reductase 1 isoform X2 n=2 Tax=Hemicordylus capensis TaxID=884348 RepID=UPI002302C713|nr:putative ferric-chelate reductase 1 isoform X2 [Hemicordylus capensis]
MVLFSFSTLCMGKLPSLFIFWEIFSSTVLSFPDGKIDASCDSMLPKHRHFVAQTNLPPYAISISNTSFNPGDEIVVSLIAMNNSNFKGFLLQARATGGDVAVGSFRIINPLTQGLECNNVQNSSLSHTNGENKQNVTAIWVAPSGVRHVVFRATVLQKFSVFWTEVQSQSLVSSSPPSVSTLPSFLQSTSPSITISTEEGCGIHKFCFSNPAGCTPHDPNCYFMSSQTLGSDAFSFEMSGLSDGYVAIGFSDDTIMGNDDIYICDRNAAIDHVEVQHAFSTGATTPTTMPLGKVEILATSFNNGIIKCSFISRNAISTHSRASDSLYYIFLTSGPSSNGKILKHPKRPFITDKKVNISSFAAVSGTWTTPMIVKAHGALMLIAWMTTGSVGMIFARYLKKSINQTLLGKDTWFQIHSFLMLLTVVATIIAFILAFVARKGWSSGAEAHAVLGCIVMILSFFQPVITFFRPSPQNKWRFVFNWFHMLNALVIKVLAVAAIFLGLKMVSNSPSLWMVKTMGGFVGWEALIALTLDVNLWLKKKEVYEDSNAKVKSEIFLLLIYLCGNLAFLIALLVGIGRS